MIYKSSLQPGPGLQVSSKYDTQTVMLPSAGFVNVGRLGGMHTVTGTIYTKVGPNGRFWSPPDSNPTVSSSANIVSTASRAVVLIFDTWSQGASFTPGGLSNANGWPGPMINLASGGVTATFRGDSGTTVTATGPTLNGIVRVAAKWTSGVGIALSVNGGQIYTAALTDTDMYYGGILSLRCGPTGWFKVYFGAAIKGLVSDNDLVALSENPYGEIFEAPPRRIWAPVGVSAPAFKAAWARQRSGVIGGGVR